mgnify:CR=1 FL=1
MKNEAPTPHPQFVFWLVHILILIFFYLLFRTGSIESLKDMQLTSLDLRFCDKLTGAWVWFGVT